MELDIAAAIKGSFSWLSDAKTWKYVFLQYAFTALSILVFGGLALLILGPALFDIFSGGTEGLGEAFFAGIGLLILTFFLWIIVWTIFTLAIAVLATNRALQVFGFRPSGGFSFNKVVKVFILGIISFIYQIFSWYSKKLMAVVLVFYLVAFLALTTVFLFPQISVFFILLTLILVLPYIAIMAYNGLRLSIALPIMLEGDTSITTALSKSWNMTQGHALMIFFAAVVLAIVTITISFAALVVGGIIGTIIDIPLGTTTNAFNANFAMQQLVSMVTTPIITIAGFFFAVSIFAQLSGSAMAVDKMTPFKPPSSFSPTAPQTQRPKWMSGRN